MTREEFDAIWGPMVDSYERPPEYMHMLDEYRQNLKDRLKYLSEEKSDDTPTQSSNSSDMP